MTKLIDADELLYVLSPTVQGDGRLFDPDIPMADIREYIRDMPPAEAIPTSWINQMRDRAKNCGDRSVAAAINYLLSLWEMNARSPAISSGKQIRQKSFARVIGNEAD